MQGGVAGLGQWFRWWQSTRQERGVRRQGKLAGAQRAGIASDQILRGLPAPAAAVARGLWGGVSGRWCVTTRVVGGRCSFEPTSALCGVFGVWHLGPDNPVQHSGMGLHFRQCRGIVNSRQRMHPVRRAATLIQCGICFTEHRETHL